MNVNLKYYISVLLFLISVSLFSQATTGVKIKYHNRTGYNLDSLTIGYFFIGRLEDDSISQEIRYDSVMIHDSRFFFAKLCGKIGDTYESNCFDDEAQAVCGTGAYWENNRSLEFDIKIIADVKKFKLYIEKHKN